MKKLIFRVRIVYKSGYTHDFDVTEFTISNNSMSWTAVDQKNKPIKLGLDEIAAVWQIGVRSARSWRNLWLR